MKRLFILSLSAAFLLSSLSVSAQFVRAQKTDVKTKVKSQNLKMKVKGELSEVALPYPVTYSSRFVMGNPANAKRVLDIWKDFDNNTLDRSATFFSDTVTMRLSNGTVVTGRAEVLDGAKTYRNSLATVESTIDAVTSVTSLDADEDWVLVWGSTKETDHQGRSKTIPLHEAWKVNRDGKIAYVLQYAVSEPVKEQK